MYCEKCGAKLQSDSIYCEKCGYRAASEAKDGVRDSPSPRAETTRWHWYTHVAYVAVIVIVVVTFLGIRYGDVLFSNASDSDLLLELEPSIEPIGYFSEPSQFENEHIPLEEWIRYVVYTGSMPSVTADPRNPRFADQTHIYSTVVKIVCEDEGYYYYGSGTNFDSAGYVVTNLHVLEGNTELSCMVGFPDPSTGVIREAYWASPIIDEAEETGHDLAILSVEDPVIDSEYRVYGYYERLTDGKFPHFEESEACLAVAPELGDQIFVLGYPSLSGGALTITDGLVSSLYSSDGYLITSAKIGSGNSGGLSVDAGGCFVGVPTAVYTNDEDENYGEIIDAFFVYEFINAVLDDIDSYIETP